MKKEATQRKERDVFYVHHGSVSASLRKETEETVNAIRDMLQNKYLPPAERKNICSSCSLIEYCMPRSPTKVLNYLDIICGADE